MSWLNKLERRLEPFAVPNITLIFVIGQAFAYLTEMLGLADLTRWLLVPALVMEGEAWRLITFLFVPPSSHWVFIAFALYFLYFTGNALEQYWGKVRYNLFLLTGYTLTVGLAFLNPGFVATNIFIAGAIFLAFAYLNPDFQLLLFFILPVRIKWIALLTWAYYAFAFVTGTWSTRLGVLAGVGNFLVFFARDMLRDLRSGQRQMKMKAERAAAAEREENEPRHRCFVCGKTDLTHPDLDFRYCSKCSGDQCYCPEHIRNHEHVVTQPDAEKS